MAIDGRSGVGKSTLAEWLGSELSATVIEGDDFYAGGIGILKDPPQARAQRCIDWQTQRQVLGALRQGQSAEYRAFDWDAFDGSLAAEVTRVSSAAIIVLEGVYSARPELRDLVDLTLLLRVSDAVRKQRLIQREGEIGPWETQWHEAEEWYFANAAPPSAFDMVIDD